jgi:hypothetical protein
MKVDLPYKPSLDVKVSRVSRNFYLWTLTYSNDNNSSGFMDFGWGSRRLAKRALKDFLGDIESGAK